MDLLQNTFKRSLLKVLILKMKSTGTLVIKGLKPGKRLFLLCTGTGVAPFISVMFEPATYENFNEELQNIITNDININVRTAVIYFFKYTIEV